MFPNMRGARIGTTGIPAASRIKSFDRYLPCTYPKFNTVLRTKNIWLLTRFGLTSTVLSKIFRLVRILVWLLNSGN